MHYLCVCVTSAPACFSILDLVPYLASVKFPVVLLPLAKFCRGHMIDMFSANQPFPMVFPWFSQHPTGFWISPLLFVGQALGRCAASTQWRWYLQLGVHTQGLVTVPFWEYWTSPEKVAMALTIYRFWLGDVTHGDMKNDPFYLVDEKLVRNAWGLN